MKDESLEDRVKERLTGAAILVALVVALVPEIVSGPDGAAQVSGSRVTEGPPLRSYTIELDPAVAPAAVDSVPLISSALPTAAPAVAAATVAPSPSPAPKAAPPEKAPAVALAASPSQPSSPSAATSAAGWVVQLGSFSRRENAERMVQAAAAKGVRLSVAGPDARGLYRVRTAPLIDRQRAAELQAQLKSQGYVGVINASQ